MQRDDARPVISPTEIRQRQQRVAEICRDRGWDALVAIGRAFYDRPGDVAYLTNHFPPFPTTPFYGEYRSFGHSAAVVLPDGSVTLCCDGSYRQDLVVADHVEATRNLASSVATVLNRSGSSLQRIGLTGLDIVPAATWLELQELLPGVAVDDASEVLWKMRTVKSPSEQELLRKAARIADAGLAAAIAASEPEVPETHICAVGTATALRAGADFVRYLRVHTGPWSRLGSRWPQATGRVLEEGDIVYLDIIGAYHGYQFDVLRTTVAGQPTDPTRKLLDATLTTLLAALEHVRPGKTAGDVYRQMAETAAHLGFGEYLGPFAGHGIGLDTVEPPFIAAGDETELVEGMVLCVEPKLTVPDIGGASIEFEVIVTKKGAEIITELPGQQW